MNTKYRTFVHREKNNGCEYGYKNEYILIGVTVDGSDDSYSPYTNMAEAVDEADIPNARRRAIYAMKNLH